MLYPVGVRAVEFEGRAGFEPAFPQRACNPWTGSFHHEPGSITCTPMSYPLNDRPESSVAFRDLRW